MMAPACVCIAVTVGASSEAGASAFASPKSSTLTVPSGRTLMLRWFQIAMDDPLLVRRFERLRDLFGDAAVLHRRGSTPARCGSRVSVPRRVPSPARRGSRSFQAVDRARCADD